MGFKKLNMHIEVDGNLCSYDCPFLNFTNGFPRRQYFCLLFNKEVYDTEDIGIYMRCDACIDANFQEVSE